MTSFDCTKKIYDLGNSPFTFDIRVSAGVITGIDHPGLSKASSCFDERWNKKASFPSLAVTETEARSNR